MYKILLSLIFISTLSACSSTPLAPIEEDKLRKSFSSPTENMAGIYIYRTSIFIGDAVNKEIYLNSQFIGKLKPKTFLYQEVMSGDHTLSSKSAVGLNEIQDNFEAGNNYFFKQSFSPSFVPLMGPATNLNRVSEKIGKEQILKSQLVAEPINK